MKLKAAQAISVGVIIFNVAVRSSPVPIPRDDATAPAGRINQTPVLITTSTEPTKPSTASIEARMDVPAALGDIVRGIGYQSVEATSLTHVVKKPPKRKAFEVLISPEVEHGKRSRARAADVPDEELLNMSTHDYREQMARLRRRREAAKDFFSWRALDRRIEKLKVARADSIRAKKTAETAKARFAQSSRMYHEASTARQHQLSSEPVLSRQLDTEKQQPGTASHVSSSDAMTSPSSPGRWLAELEQDTEFWDRVNS